MHAMYPVKNFHLPLKEVFNDFYSFEGDQVRLGLEFENELKHPVDFGSIPGWKFHNEHSLRDFGYEFVSSKPLPRDQMEKSVELLFRRIQATIDKFKEATSVELTPSNSIRTSVHVHLDATKLSYIQVLNFATVYWLLEDFLTGFCGETRRGNLFCLRLRDAAFQKHNLLREFKELAPFASSAFTDSQRYASLNLAAVRKFGTLESRLMRGTTDINLVMTWVDCLLAIYEFALKFDTPKAIQKDFLESCDATDYPMHVLGFGLTHKMLGLMENPMSHMQMAQDIRENYIELVELFAADKTFDFREIAKKQNVELEKRAKEQAKMYEQHVKNLKKKTKTTLTFEEPIHDDIFNEPDTEPAQPPHYIPTVTQSASTSSVWSNSSFSTPLGTTGGVNNGS